MAHKKDKKKESAPVKVKGDLYHDIEQKKKEKIDRKEYEKELLKLNIELIKLQEWVKAKKLNEFTEEMLLNPC